MKTEYTQGEWKIFKSVNPRVLNPKIKSVAANGVDKKIIAECYIHTLAGQSNISIEEAEANAKIIASAPDLLEALQELLRFSKSEVPEKYRNEYTAIWNNSEAAIKKATT